MPSISRLAVAQANARLSIDFGHAPISSIWNRGRVQTPRDPLSPSLQKARTGAALRAVHVATPRWAFADSKRRAALERTSEATSQLIGALLQEPVDEVAVGLILQRLPDMMLPLPTHGANAVEVFTVRLGLHLQKLSGSQLVQLRDALASSSARDPHIEAAATAVDVMLEARMADAARLAMSPVWALEQHSSELTKLACQVLEEYGQADKDDPQRQVQLVAQTLANMMPAGQDHSETLQSLLEGLPIVELRMLAAPQPARQDASSRTVAGHDARVQIQTAAKACLEQRYVENIEDFNTALAAIDASRSPASVSSVRPRMQAATNFARSVIAATDVWLSLKTDSTTIGRPRVMNDARRVLLKAKVGQLVSSGGFLVSRVDERALPGFERSLKALGLDDQSRAVANEIEKRHLAHFADLANAASEALTKGEDDRCHLLFEKTAALAADIFAARERAGLPQERGITSAASLQRHLMHKAIDHLPEARKATAYKLMDAAAERRFASDHPGLRPALVL